MKNVKRFQIKKLFNYIDVDLPLDKDVNIFLGENGLGKTTILNCLYNTLSTRFEKLRDINFESIKIIFSDNEEYIINYNDVIEYSNYILDNHYIRYSNISMDRLFSEKELKELKDIVSRESYSKRDIAEYIYRLSDVLRIPLRIAEKELLNYINMYGHNKMPKGNIENVQKLREKIENYVQDEIIYFPTYRRIEEDLSKLDIDIEKNNIKTKLIHFGMDDIIASIDKTLANIRSIAINSFTEMTGVLLTQYLSEDISSNIKKIEKDKLSIVLDRIGDKIDPKSKELIKDSVNSEKIYNKDNIYLLNLLNNLIKSYEKQLQFDEKIKKFVVVCNKYLVGKSFYYDESNLKLDLVNNRNNEIINIDNLSSGEKQLISIFSKLLLENEKKCIILFDEPELSLSIEWQSNLLPDIMDSEKCSKLITVTHSPFIFENKYDLLASDMGRCLKYN